MAGHQVGCCEVHQHQIGIHTLFQHTALLGSTLGLGPAEGGHHQGGGAGQGRGIPLGGPDGHGSAPHDLEHIQIARLDGPVGPQSHIHTGLHQVCNGGTGLAVFRGGQGQRHGAYLFLAQHFGLLALQEGAAGSRGRDGEEPVAGQQLPGGHACAVQAGVHLIPGFAQMQLHAQPLLAGIARQRFPEGIVRGIFCEDARIDFDPAVVIAVPLVHNLLQLPALLVGLKVEFLVLVDVAIAGQGQIGLDAAFGHSLGGGIGVVIKIGHGGHAEAQALRNGQQSRCLGAAGVHLGFLLQQGLQGLFIGQVIGEAPQHRSCQVGVAVDEAWHGHHAGALNDGLRHFLRDLFGDKFDFPIGNADVDPKEDLGAGGHGHGGDVGN